LLRRCGCKQLPSSLIPPCCGIYLRHHGNVAVGLCPGHLLGYGLREFLGAVPAVLRRIDRNDDVKALAARGLDEALEAKGIKAAADFKAGELSFCINTDSEKATNFGPFLVNRLVTVSEFPSGSPFG
jgi:hypothetical protein